MSSQPSNNPVVQQLQLLLTGYGYNFYSSVDRARADDLLVRERASYFLGQAVLSWRTAQRVFAPFHPSINARKSFPPQETMAQLREMEAVQQELSNIETYIRGMSVPSQDRTWWRFRQEQTLLGQLLGFDLALVRGCEQLYHYISQLTPEKVGTVKVAQHFAR